MRPDEDKRLVSMGKGEPTCERCIIELHPSGDGSVCDDCGLNPIQRAAEMSNFIRQTARREMSFERSELVQRFRILNS